MLEYAEEYRLQGDQLINVRYRESDDKEEIVTTVEIVVDERPKPPTGGQQRGYLAAKARSIVGVHIGFRESELRGRVKQCGGRGDNDRKLWRMPRDKANALGLKGRIMSESNKKCTIPAGFGNR